MEFAALTAGALRRTGSCNWVGGGWCSLVLQSATTPEPPIWPTLEVTCTCQSSLARDHPRGSK